MFQTEVRTKRNCENRREKDGRKVGGGEGVKNVQQRVVLVDTHFSGLYFRFEGHFQTVGLLATALKRRKKKLQ